MARKFLIKGSRHTGKQIEVTKYNRTANGVEIAITHNVPVEADKQLRWVQSITENGTFFKTCGERTYIDPFGKVASWTSDLPSMPGVCKADDVKPFYETDSEFATNPNFYDKPGEAAPKSGRTWIIFVTALTEVVDTTVNHLVAINWGFDRMANGEVRVAAIVTPTDVQMKGHMAALKKMYPDYTYT